MIELIKELDGKLLVYFNSFHSPFWDEVMLKATDRFFWVPFYALIVLFLIWKFKKGSFLLIILIAVMVIFSDFLTSSLMKPFFERVRPCYNESLAGSLRVLNGCGGKFGFVSSHASNTFALTIFLILLLRKSYKWIYTLLIWCTLVSYSRIYLGVHYPGDILGGAVTGSMIAFSFHILYIWSGRKFKLQYTS